MRTAIVASAALVAAVLAGCESHADSAGPSSAAVGSEDADPGRGRAASPHADKTPPGATLVREDLPAVVRDVLRQRMERHADSMEGLLRSSLLLQYELIVERSEGVMSEPRIARPREGDERDLINHVLPARFFDLQEELHRQADELLRAAERRDDEGIAGAYGHLAGTCIRCHALYLHLPRPEASDR